MENLQFEDFFIGVHDDYKGFVSVINDMVQKDYSNVKITTSKTDVFKVAYSQPKTRRGIVNFYLRKRGFKMAVFAKHCGNYPDVFAGLPEAMVAQIDKAGDCLNLKEPGKCMDKCAGYDFHVGENHYQKCRFGCFQFNVDAESIPFLTKMVERELVERSK